MKAYVDKSGKEFSIHCLDQEDLEMLMKIMAKQISKPNVVKDHIAPDEKKRIFKLLILIENEIPIN